MTAHEIARLMLQLPDADLGNCGAVWWGREPGKIEYFVPTDPAKRGQRDRLWARAHMRMQDDPSKSQTEHYQELLAESATEIE